MQSLAELARDGTPAQVASEGRRFLSDPRTIGQGIRLIQDLSRGGRHRDAVELAETLFELRRKSRDLNVLMSAVLAEGVTDEVQRVTLLATSHQSGPAFDYDVQLLATWLRALYELDDQPQFWRIFDAVCSESDKTGNLYIVGQYFRMLIRVGRYQDVLSHWERLDPSTKQDGFILKHKARALIELGRLAEAEETLTRTRDDHLKRSLVGRLGDIKKRFGIRDDREPRVGESSATGTLAASPAARPVVFVLHGQDRQSRSELEIVLHRIGAEPRTFDHLPNDGRRTVIEVLEQYVPDSDAIVTLLTPDDEGKRRGTDEAAQPRARENVLIEAGYAMLSRRSRSLLVALGGVHVPSDFEGVHRIQSSCWDRNVAVQVAQRLRAMGLAVDPSRAI